MDPAFHYFILFPAILCRAFPHYIHQMRIFRLIANAIALIWHPFYQKFKQFHLQRTCGSGIAPLKKYIYIYKIYK